jgi:hypothetical protein
MRVGHVCGCSYCVVLGVRIAHTTYALVLVLFVRLYSRSDGSNSVFSTRASVRLAASLGGPPSVVFTNALITDAETRNPN